MPLHHLLVVGLVASLENALMVARRSGTDAEILRSAPALRLPDLLVVGMDRRDDVGLSAQAAQNQLDGGARRLPGLDEDEAVFE
jgi:hypothetical protein